MFTHILQQLESLDVVLAVGGVGGPVLIDKVVGIQVVDEGAGTLVPALGATVDNARSIDVDGTRRSGVTHRFHSLHEVVGGPGTGLLVDILEGTAASKAS